MSKEPNKSIKNIMVSRDTHSFLILHKIYGNYKSIDEYLKDKLNIGVKK